MKEIDFLPNWYKEGKRRQVNVQRQYMALVGIFLVMVTYNLVATHKISNATANISAAESRRAEAEDIKHEVEQLTEQISKLKVKAGSIEHLDSRIDVAAVLAEISFLVDSNVVLKSVDIVVEKFENKPEKQNKLIRIVGSTPNKYSNAPVGDVRFKITIDGIASDQSYVAALICALEESTYFHKVYPAFSRNKKITVNKFNNQSQPNLDVDVPINTSASFEIDVTEFEILFYLANYEIQENQS